MGRFGPLDGLLLLALHALALGLSLGLARRSLPLPRMLLLSLGSFALAFIAHVLAFIALRALAPAALEDSWVRRPVVAAVWGLAGAAVLLLPALRLRRAYAYGALLTALAYLAFALWRG